MEARSRYRYRWTMQQGTLRGDPRTIRLKTPLCKAFEPPITCTNVNYSWVRVFEVGYGRVAEEKAIKDSINMAEKYYAYWLRLSGVIRSDPAVLQSFDSELKEAVARFDKELVKAKEKYTKAYTAWMECVEIDAENCA
jgi:hypothetical protein